MNDTERLREISWAILSDSKDEGRIRYAAELLKLASDIENQKASASMSAANEQKIIFDLSESKGHRKSENWKAFITLLAPVLTTIILAGTLVVQSYQFAQSEKDKQMETLRQADAAEDVRWTDAIKLLSQSEKVSPAGVLLKSFVKSNRYGSQAQQTAYQILLKTEDPTQFANLFTLVFEPVDWGNLSQVADLNRSLYLSEAPILEKTFNREKLIDDLSKLSPAERKTYNSILAEEEFIDAQIALLLKSHRPSGVALDLHSTDILQCDLKNADLSGANLDGANVSSVDLKGANLTGISHGQLDLYLTAWWEASEISPETFQYLLKQDPFRPTARYGTSGRTIPQNEYDENIARLQRITSTN
jgi:hypothetical protein